MIPDERKTVALVVRFFGTNDRWPSAAADSDYERSLGVWLNRQRVDEAVGRMDPFRRGYLDQMVPGWRSSPAEIWLDRAREVSNFLLRNGARPQLRGPGEGERFVARWLLSQQALAQVGMLHPARLGWLDRHCPGWRPTPRQAVKTAPVATVPE